ncbi:MAG: hypothetical protein Ctma_0375 [Catillopecten margaritatus gill symbiont]|uniref:Uncharacterized protein n=1 Tax=Catillopecten margaritatus gill symbiont TaxID=3083288 RepID=A0AAU6PF95_9GAMM
MNQLPINKILIAGFAFAMTHWKKILEISIIPVMLSLPLFSILSELFALMEQVFSAKKVIPSELIVPDNTHLYLVLFLYANVSLSVGMYRLVALGEQSVGITPILDWKVIARFIGMTLLVGIVTMTPLILTNLLILQFVMSFLMVPITLNFVNIAVGKPSKYRWGLSFPTHMNLFFLQVIVPLLVVLLFTSLSNLIGLGAGAEWVARALMFYWSAITLVLCHQLITTSKQTP